MISLKERCNQCSHHATCKYSGDYERFFATLTDKIGKWNSEFVFIPTIELSCKYFAPIKENYKGTRASFTSIDDFVKPIIAEDLKKQVAAGIEDFAEYTETVKDFGINHL